MPSWGSLAAIFLAAHGLAASNGYARDPDDEERPPASAEPSAPSDPFAALDAYAQSRNADAGVAVFDSAGPLHEYHADVQIRSASIIKVGILAALLDQAAREGRFLRPEEQDLAGRMIRYSDNDAATVLWARLGARRVLSFLQSLGMDRTRPDPEAPDAWGWTLTTAHDFALLASRLLQRQIATPELCDYALALMTQVTENQTWGIAKGLPEGTWTAFKNGWYPEETVWRVNAVGIIKPADSAPYALAILSRYDVTLGEGYGIETIQRLSSLAYAAHDEVEKSAAQARRREQQKERRQERFPQ